MKRILTIIISCFFILQIFGQQISEAPVNPEFTAYINSSLKIPAVTADGFTLGELPSPHKYHLETNTSFVNPDFDAAYDMRTAGAGGTSLLTSVKNQGSCGCCWTFATMASIESRWFVTGEGTFDLSENNLKECHNFDYLSCNGGNIDMSTAYLSRRSGPISETDDPYSTADGSCTSGLTPVAYVTDARFIANDMNTIKQAILDFGALFTNMYYSDTYYNSTNKTYYYDGASGTNHAVTLVGWDDNKVTAGGTGAWIIKNSWGTFWGESGFFYVSYLDTKINSTVGFFPIRTDYDAQTEVYYYDEFGDVGTFGYGGNTAYGCIKYTASADQMIKKIGTYAEASGSVIGIQVYDNFNGTTFSGLLGSISDQTCTFPGYYTFDLPTPISISSGNDFFIRVYYNTPAYNYPIPVESAVGGYSSAAVIETGVCWSSSSGAAWTALGQGTSYLRDVCIKAYAENILAPTVLAEPNANTICSGENASYSITSNGSLPAYHWQLSTNGGTNWSDLSNVAPYSNVTTSAMDITSATIGMNNYQYRCYVTNAYGSDTSNAALLNITLSPSVDAQPIDMTVCSGANASFDITASGSSIGYQWQISTNGGSSWTNLTNTPPYSNVTSSPLNISTATAGLNGYQYHCVVSNTCTSDATSDAALLTVNPLPVVDLGINTEICAVDNIVLDPGSGYDTYEWSTGETSQTITVDSTGTGQGDITIYVTVTESSCINTDSINILFKPIPQTELGNDTMLCGGENITLDPGAGFDTYSWSTGESSQAIVIDSAGVGFGSITVYLTVTENSCSNNDSIDVLFDDCTGINPNEIKDGVTLFPNPSDDIINIIVENAEKGTVISITDVTGKEIKNIVSDKKINRFNISDLPAGTYFISVINSKINYSDKFLITRKPGN
jgi:C1A family cysteine protease